MENQTRRSQTVAALALLLAGGCTEDARIVATFRQGADERGFASRQEGAYYYYNPPTVAGGHVFIGTSRKLFEDPRPDNFFFKLDANLHKVWEVALGRDEVRGGAAVGTDGRIYFVVEKGRVAGERQPVADFLYCLAPDGKLLWQYPLNSGGANWDNDVGMTNPAIAADGTVYVGGEKLHAIAPDGSLRWAYPAGAETLNVKNAPVVDPSGNLYFAASGRVHALAPDGTRRWWYPDTGGWEETLASPALSFDHARVYAGRGSSLLCLEAATGALHWSVWLSGGTIRATPAVDDQGNAYVGTKGSRESVFHAVSAAGAILWSNPIGADLYSSPALGDDRTVYVGSEQTDAGRFHALDMATGARRWAVKGLGADVTWSSPALVDGGLIYVGSMDGSVYAIRSDANGLLRNAGSARFHGGNDSTGRHE